MSETIKTIEAIKVSDRFLYHYCALTGLKDGPQYSDGTIERDREVQSHEEYQALKRDVIPHVRRATDRNMILVSLSLISKRCVFEQPAEGSAKTTDWAYPTIQDWERHAARYASPQFVAGWKFGRGTGADVCPPGPQTGDWGDGFAMATVTNSQLRKLGGAHG